MTDIIKALDNVNIESINAEGLFRKFKITVPAGFINQRVADAISKEALTFKMPGFREGKVPSALVKRQIGQEVLRRELGQIVDSSVTKAIRDSNSVPSLTPEVALEGMSGDLAITEVEKDLIINVSFEALPEIPKIDFPSISITVDSIAVSDTEMDRAKKDILKRLRDLEEAVAGHKASVNDLVTFKSEGKVDEVDFPLANSNEVQINIGHNESIPGLDDHLIGLSVGDKKEFDLTLPNDYPHHPGKTVHFSIEILKIMTTVNSLQWDDELAKRIGYDTIDKLDNILRDRIQGEFSIMERFQAKKELFDVINDKYDFEMPVTMLEADKKQLSAEMSKSNAGNSSIAPDIDIISKRRVKLGLVIADTARNNNIKVTEDDFKKVIEMHAAQFPDRMKEVVEFYSKPENLRMIEAPLLEEKTVDFMLSQIKVNKLEAISFIEFNQKHSVSKSNDIVQL